MSADPYSRFVLFLRIALPMVALGILSTLFFFSSKIRSSDVVPFERTEIEDRVREKRITQPIFTGLTSSGDKMAFTADQILTGSNGQNTAVNLTGLLEFTEGGSMDLVADHGTFDEDRDNATLTGNVLIESTAGYTLRSQLMTSTLTQLDLISPGRVDGTGPGSTLTAERMQITANEEGENVQFLFSGGVKLVYDPNHD